MRKVKIVYVTAFVNHRMSTLLDFSRSGWLVLKFQAETYIQTTLPGLFPGLRENVFQFFPSTTG